MVPQRAVCTGDRAPNASKRKIRPLRMICPPVRVIGRAQQRTFVWHLPPMSSGQKHFSGLLLYLFVFVHSSVVLVLSECTKGLTQFQFSVCAVHVAELTIKTLILTSSTISARLTLAHLCPVSKNRYLKTLHSTSIQVLLINITL